MVERSVTIAGISTRELVAKDFVTEPNEDKLRKAGHLMAQKLAGSLALVTCKEPLKGNLGSHIRHFLSEVGFTEVSQSLVDPFVSTDILSSKWSLIRSSTCWCKRTSSSRAKPSRRRPWTVRSSTSTMASLLHTSIVGATER